MTIVILNLLIEILLLRLTKLASGMLGMPGCLGLAVVKFKAASSVPVLFGKPASDSLSCHRCNLKSIK